MPYQEAKVLLRTGRVNTIIGEMDTAFRHFQQATALFEKLGRTYEKHVTMGDIAWLHYRRKNYDKAVELFKQVLAYGKEAGMMDYLGGVWDRLGTVYRALKQFEQAETAYRNVMQLIPPEKERDLAVVRTNMAGLYFEWGRYDTGLNLCRVVLEKPPQTFGLEDFATIHWHRARILRAKGNSQQALGAYHTCIEYMETLRKQSRNRAAAHAIFQQGFQFIEDAMSFYHQLYLRHPKDGYAEQAFLFLERVRARGLLDRVSRTMDSGLSETIFPQPDGMTEADLPKMKSGREPGDAPLFSLEAIRSTILQPDTALCSFFLGDTLGYRWILTKDKLAFDRLTEYSRLEERIDAFLHALLNPNVLNTAQQKLIGRALVETILGELSADDRPARLVILPDGRLFDLPYAALPSLSDSKNTFFMHDYELVLLPSASFLTQMRRLPKTPRPDKFAVFADPVYRRQDDRFQAGNHTSQAEERGVPELSPEMFPRIRASFLEYTHLKNLVPDPLRFDGFTGFTATREQLLGMALPNYRLLHFAAHGHYVSGEPSLSGLVLSMLDSEGRPIPGFLSGTHIKNLRLNADLVVLSACQSARGRYYRGEGVVGLCREFLAVGAASVVAGLWNVNDQATAALMAYFYDAQHKQGMATAAALKLAQQKMAANPRWKAPRYWAGFVLIGEWDKKIFSEP
ncbi:MAG: CHAT domain-containing protein [Acidobacteriota bacterium]|nr:CHAT domain-containing protein [Acidobacteriota bacterium]